MRMHLLITASMPRTNTQSALTMQVPNRQSRGQNQRVTVVAVELPGLQAYALCPIMIQHQEMSQVNQMLTPLAF